MDRQGLRCVAFGVWLLLACGHICQGLGEEFAAVDPWMLPSTEPAVPLDGSLNRLAWSSQTPPYAAPQAMFVPYSPGGAAENVFRLTQAAEAYQPYEAELPELFPAQIGGGGTPNLGVTWDWAIPDVAAGTTPAAAGVDSQTQAYLAAVDTGALLQEADSVQTVDTQRRSPVSFDPHIRGYNGGQIYTLGDGAFWTPVRQDLDSMLSKIDPSLIRDVVVVPGPYGLRYGPGFSFINVVTYDTPRYQNGYEGHARIGMNYRTNSHGVYGLTTLYGGNANYGYVFSYSNRTGDDYYIGGNGPISRVPSSYHNQNFWGQFGFDLSPNSNLEVRYSRLDQVDTEYAAQFFDVNSAVTDGFTVAYNRQDPDWDRKFRAETWYNRTGFQGDTERSNKRSDEFPVINRVDAALRAAFGSVGAPEMQGYVDGDVRSTGARVATTWGPQDAAQLSLGTDVRFLEQHIHERYDLSSFGEPDIETNLPRAQMIDPGAFAELNLPLTSYWTTSIGARVDWAHTTAEDEGGLPDGWRGEDASSLDGFPEDRDQNDLLYAFYLTNDLDLSCNWKTRFGLGHAQRVPTLVERYADSLFLGIIQNGFSRVNGNPALRKERDWQVDVSLEADYDRWRSRTSGFYAWIDDYITYEANEIADPAGARLLHAINTAYATLAGVEWYGELDITSLLTMFGSVRYIDGRDQEIQQPLAQIAPLEGRMGFRLEDPCEAPRWGGEFGYRMVDRQHREAYFRPTDYAPGDSLVQVEQETPGFTTAYMRSYWNVRDSLRLIGGVENLFDRTYVEHLDLRLPNDPVLGFANTVVYAPGITPYFGIEWER